MAAAAARLAALTYLQERPRRRTPGGLHRCGASQPGMRTSKSKTCRPLLIGQSENTVSQCLQRSCLFGGIQATSKLRESVSLENPWRLGEAPGDCYWRYNAT